MEPEFVLVANKLGWDTERIEIKFQESGLTNRNYVVTNGMEKVVVRIGGGKIPRFGDQSQGRACRNGGCEPSCTSKYSRAFIKYMCAIISI